MSLTVRILAAGSDRSTLRDVERVLCAFHAELPGKLEGANFTVDGVDQIDEALAKFDARPPDVLMLDLALRGHRPLLEKSLAELPAVQTIVLSSDLTDAAAFEMFHRGCVDVRALPAAPEALRRSAIRAAHLVAAYRQNQASSLQFAAVVAHELKAPLDAVEGYLQMLQDGIGRDDPAMMEQVFSRCMTRTQQMRQMVTDLGEVSRLEIGAGRKTPHAEVDLRDVARKVMETFAPAAQRQDVKMNLHADGPVKVLANIDEMETILNNLVSNAVKYNRPGGQIDLSIQANGHWVTLAVADTGIGMVLTDSSRLFNEFVRIKSARTRSIPGTGLGLAIVRRLVDAYGGDVNVATQPDVGSTFTVRLPKPEAAAS